MTKGSQSLWNGREEITKTKTKLYRFIIDESIMLVSQVHPVCAIGFSNLRQPQLVA